MYSSAVGWKVHLVYRVIQVSCFCIDFLSRCPIHCKGDIESPSITGLLSISAFRSVNIFLLYIYLGALLSAYIFIIVILLVESSFSSLYNDFPCL